MHLQLESCTQVSVYSGLTYLLLFNIRVIPFRAQAETLVQRAQQSSLEMDDIWDDNPLNSDHLSVRNLLPLVKV